MDQEKKATTVLRESDCTHTCVTRSCGTALSAQWFSMYAILK